MRGILFFAVLAFGVGIVHGLPFAWTEVEGHEADIGEAAAGYRDFSVKATFWNSEETPVSSISSSVLHVGHGKQEGNDFLWAAFDSRGYLERTFRYGGNASGVEVPRMTYEGGREHTLGLTFDFALGAENAPEGLTITFYMDGSLLNKTDLSAMALGDIGINGLPLDTVTVSEVAEDVTIAYGVGLASAADFGGSSPAPEPTAGAIVALLCAAGALRRRVA